MRFVILGKTGGKGVRIIKDSTRQFQDIIDGLEEGVAKCDEKLDKNNAIKAEIETENSLIETEKAKAVNLSTNLSTLMKDNGITINTNTE